ncbi:hypothetical protein DPMN_089048 [Dreissena polymorpha]|uniref:Uncharacterized protein n=1 Tax=Dreissena polymorpha TaxID=45954 RepID=A0A9D4KVN2_DREPO|nr:hypothetical protein DPMN_089048 [Dreissena polymorpha]
MTRDGVHSCAIFFSSHRFRQTAVIAAAFVSPLPCLNYSEITLSSPGDLFTFRLRNAFFNHALSMNGFSSPASGLNSF